MIEPAWHVAKLDEGVVACGQLGVGDEPVCVSICARYGLTYHGDAVRKAFAESYFFFGPFLRGFFFLFEEESLS